MCSHRKSKLMKGCRGEHYQGFINPPKQRLRSIDQYVKLFEKADSRFSARLGNVRVYGQTSYTSIEFTFKDENGGVRI